MGWRSVTSRQEPLGAPECARRGAARPVGSDKDYGHARLVAMKIPQFLLTANSEPWLQGAHGRTPPAYLAPRPTGFLHEPALLQGSSSPVTGRKPGPKGRVRQLTSDACHGQGTRDGGGKLLRQPACSHTRGTPACQMEGEHSRNSFCLPWGDPRRGHSAGLGPSHPTSRAANSTTGQSKRHSG